MREQNENTNFNFPAVRELRQMHKKVKFPISPSTKSTHHIVAFLCCINSNTFCIFVLHRCVRVHCATLNGCVCGRLAEFCLCSKAHHGNGFPQNLCARICHVRL